MFSRTHSTEGGMRPVTHNIAPKGNNNHSFNTANKTTSVGGSSWFCFAEAGNDGSTSTLGTLNIYPDSNLYVAAGTPPFYWWCHGIGTSLDPKSVYFNPGGLYVNPSIAAPHIIVSATDAYTVDSIEVAGFYSRIKNYTDTLYIDVVAVPQDSAWFVTWHGTDLASYGITQVGDTTMQVGDVLYDHVGNKISTAVPNVARITKILDAAAATDTIPGGLNDWTFRLPSTISVPAGGLVVAYAHFASGYTYPYGTNIDSANAWYNLSYDDNHTALQLPNDDNGGLVVTSDEKYATANAIMLGSYPIMVPTYFYTAPTVIHEPWFNTHIVCPTCALVAVNNVAAKISGVKAFPNPANNTVNINFTLATAANTTVTLTNVMGQVVATQVMNNVTSGTATFSTAALPAGVYAYSVIAGEARTSGNIVVAH